MNSGHAPNHQPSRVLNRPAAPSGPHIITPRPSNPSPDPRDGKLTSRHLPSLSPRCIFCTRAPKPMPACGGFAVHLSSRWGGSLEVSESLHCRVFPFVLLPSKTGLFSSDKAWGFLGPEVVRCRVKLPGDQCEVPGVNLEIRVEPKLQALAVCGLLARVPVVWGARQHCTFRTTLCLAMLSLCRLHASPHSQPIDDRSLAFCRIHARQNARRCGVRCMRARVLQTQSTPPPVLHGVLLSSCGNGTDQQARLLASGVCWCGRLKSNLWESVASKD